MLYGNYDKKSLQRIKYTILKVEQFCGVPLQKYAPVWR